jgi:hypothetical protein
MLNEELTKKWAPILEHEDLGEIKDVHRRNVTAWMLENTAKALTEESRQLNSKSYGLLGEATAPTNIMGASDSQGTGPVEIFDPVLISLVRRAMPNLIAYDICGVQPMTGPTGLIFAMRARYSNQAGSETFYNEVNTHFSTVAGGANTLGDKHVGNIPGNNTVSANLAETGLYNYADAMSTAQAEQLGDSANTPWPEMAFSIEKVTVSAQSRALKAEYSMELAQDLKAVHGLDAESELSNILSSEILAEINREIVRTINVTAKQGSRENVTTAGFFDLDTDSNGRWAVEKFKGLMFHLEREANRIAKETRRGKGNLLICSSDVASALQMAGVLDYAPALNSNNLQVDDTGNTFAGVLNGRFRVYVDPYADGLLGGFAGLNYCTVGYKGSSAMDAGLFYCPYVPLQMVRAVDHDTFQPKIGFKTRYGVVANPFNDGATAAGTGALVKDTNVYYRRTLVKNLM